MEKKAFIRTKGFYFAICLIALSTLYPMHLFGQSDNPQKPNKVEINEGLVSVDVQDAEISDVLNEIGRVTGVPITIGEKLVGQKVTASFEKKDVEDALREVLRGHSYVLSYTHDPADKEKKTLKEVKAKGDAIGSKTLKGKLITVEIPYGTGKGEIGIINEGEGAMSAPTSFAVDDAGKIYIPDAINHRILIFSTQGRYLSDIPIETGASDIIVDNKGFIYIYVRGERKLYQYDKSGTIVTSIDIDSARPVRGRLHLVNSAIYYYYCDAERCSYFVIGRVLSDNTLLKVPYEEQEQEQSTLTLSGKKYKGRKFIEGYNTYTDIIDKNGLASKTISLPSEGILLGDILGEDIRGDIYFSRAPAEYKYQLYEIDKFDPEGNYIGTAKIPGGHHAFRGIKDFELSKNGNVYNFIPEAEKAILHIFTKEDN